MPAPDLSGKALSIQYDVSCQLFIDYQVEVIDLFPVLRLFTMNGDIWGASMGLGGTHLAGEG